jgi:hypothetical protein
MGGGAAAVLLLIAAPQTAWAEDQNSQITPQRPAIMFDRWQEEWSVLADPRVPRQPFDEFKYIPLSDADRCTYLSFWRRPVSGLRRTLPRGFGTGANRN